MKLLNILLLASGEISLWFVIQAYAGLLLVAVVYFIIRAALREREYRRRNRKYFQP